MLFKVIFFFYVMDVSPLFCNIDHYPGMWLIVHLIVINILASVINHYSDIKVYSHLVINCHSDVWRMHFCMNWKQKFFFSLTISLDIQVKVSDHGPQSPGMALRKKHGGETRKFQWRPLADSSIYGGNPTLCLENWA